MKTNNYLQAIAYTKMWNNLSTESIKDLVTDDIRYFTSPIDGKEKFLKIVGSRLNEVKKCIRRKEFSLIAQLVKVKGFKNEYFVLIKKTVDYSGYDLPFKTLESVYLERIHVLGGLICDIEFIENPILESIKLLTINPK